jgi:hypothetical protein
VRSVTSHITPVKHVKSAMQKSRISGLWSQARFQTLATGPDVRSVSVEAGVFGSTDGGSLGKRWWLHLGHEYPEDCDGHQSHCHHAHEARRLAEALDKELPRNPLAASRLLLAVRPAPRAILRNASAA